MTPPMPPRDYEEVPDIDQVFDDPAASDWIKSSLRSALERDPVDAANDADILARILDHRCHQLLAK